MEATPTPTGFLADFAALLDCDLQPFDCDLPAFKFEELLELDLTLAPLILEESGPAVSVETAAARPRRGRPKPDRTRARMSVAALSRSPEALAHIREAAGSPSARLKMSAAAKANRAAHKAEAT